MQNISISNRSQESESESYRNEKLKGEEKIMQLERNLEFLTHENFNLKSKLQSIEINTTQSSKQNKSGNETRKIKSTHFSDKYDNRLIHSYANKMTNSIKQENNSSIINNN
jgi:hypothetical protein